jgi:D-sedoheptulose 7-phosphate isomerase
VDLWGNYLSRQSELALAGEKNENLLRELCDDILKASNSESSLILTAGNGGSATTADHFAADLSLSRKRGGVTLSAICLNSHLGLNTALSNDVSYEDALAVHLENYINVAALLIVFSASGNSKNILKLLQIAVQNEIPSWALLGFDGGLVASIPDVKKLIFPDKTRNYGLTENIHLSATHFIVDQLAIRTSER